MLSKSRIIALRSRLLAHHSRDPLLIARMSNASSGPWRCSVCRQMAKATSEYCSHCGKHWSKVWDSYYAPHKDGGGRGQTVDARSPRSRAREQWPEPPQRSVSRRSRRRSEGGKKGGKGESKGKTKKDGTLLGGRSSGQIPDLPQLQAEAPWLPPAMPAAPPTPAPPPPATPESVQMRSLLTALKKANADLPPDVQAAMQKLNQDDGKTMTKQLHAAVSNLGNAKKSLAELSLARANLHTGWNSFLEAAITRWQRYSEEFTQQDQDLAGQIEKAKEAVKVCKENFRSLQKSEGVAKDDTAEVISDEEELTVPSKVDEHMSQMQQSLKALKGGMEEELRVAKRQRLDAGAQPQDGQGLGSTPSLYGGGGN